MRAWVLLGSVGALSVLGTSAYAQEAASPEAITPATSSGQSTSVEPRPGDGGTVGQLDEIVVTAQRRRESVQSVPIAISVVSGQTLTERGATTVNDLQRLVPSLQVEPAFGGGQPQFRLRGVGFEDYATNNSPTVGTYIDDIAYPIPANTQGLLFDIERVEVLRGPQGTLYGRNTTGGALNIATAAPTASFSAGALAEYGRFDTFRGEGFVSGPLAEGLSARLSIGATQGGGFQRERDTRQHLGDADVIAGRVKLAYERGPVHVTLIGQYNRDRSEGRGVYLFTPTPGPNPVGPDDRRTTGFGLSPSFAALLGYPVNQKPFRDNDSYTGSANIAVDVGPVTLTSISAYQNLNRIELNDWAALRTGNSDVWFRSKADVVSQEFRLASNGEDRLRYTLGVYYSNEKLNEVYRSDFLDAGFGLSAFTPYRQRTESISGFGQLEYKLTNALTLIGGARYEFESRRLIGIETLGLIPNGPTIPFVTPQNRRITIDDWSGKVGLQYQLRPDVLLYATASKGLKSGGFTAVNTLAVSQVDPFKPETLYAYEAGVKGDFADHRVRINASGYYYDYRDQQVQGVVLNTVNGVTTRIGRITNAPRSEIFGGEVELTVRPVPPLTISQTVGYVHGEYREFLDPDLGGAIIDRKGQRIGFPELTYNGDVRYTLPAGAYDVTGQMNYSFRDNSTLAVLRTAGDTFKVASYWLVDASLSVGPHDGKWQAALWGRNILDAGYDLARNFFIGGYNIAAPGTPATYGVRGSVRF